MKENQPELLREAQRFTSGPPATVQSDAKQELRCWDLPQLDWPAADRLVGVVKTVRIDHKRQVTVSRQDDHLSRSRWRIDAEVFQTITTGCHLRHPAVHQAQLSSY